VKKTRIFSGFPFLAALLALQCANPSVVVLTNNGITYPTVEPDSVRITTELISGPGYAEIGYLFIQDNDLERVVRLSRKRAGAVGGQAIMNARIGVNIKQVGSFLAIPIFDQSYFVKGVVVRRRSD